MMAFSPTPFTSYMYKVIFGVFKNTENRARQRKRKDVRIKGSFPQELPRIYSIEEVLNYFLLMKIFSLALLKP